MKKSVSTKSASLSRRGFLKSAVAGGAAFAATAPLAGAGAARKETLTGKPKDPLEDVLQRYGSEFGDMRRVK